MGKLPLLKEAKTRVETRVVGSRVRIPLYVRVNTLKIGDVHSVETQLRHDFPTVEFSRDDHVEMLYKFPPSTNFSPCTLYRRGEIILQDKASCMPAAALHPPHNTTVLDACSAPGNKTLHLSALMGNTGRIFAVERDSKRFRKLQRNVSRHGAKNITPVQSDFLAIDPQQDPYNGVTHILVDPSCSGSGMLTERLLSEINPTPQCEIAALSQLQTKLLTHALSFPSVRRVVYSTCSVYAEENEHVVLHVLNSCSARDWELEHVLPTWERRGDVTVFDDAYKCVRCLPQDGTNGFFLACFRRIEPPNDGEDEGMKIQNLFSVGHLKMRFKLKHHYKISHKFIRMLNR